VSLVRLFSFDIDGTLEIGQPPGIIPVKLVRAAQGLGDLVGSGSDRPVGYQQEMWRRLGIVADFAVLKHQLGDIRARFAADAYYHVGDSEADEQFATAAGFRFLRADSAAHRTWGPELFPESSAPPA